MIKSLDLIQSREVGIQFWGEKHTEYFFKQPLTAGSASCPQCTGHSLNFTIQDLSSSLAMTSESFQLLFLGKVRLCPLTSLCLHHSVNRWVLLMLLYVIKKVVIPLPSYLCNLSFHKYLNCIFRGRLSRKSARWGVPQIRRGTIIKRHLSEVLLAF